MGVYKKVAGIYAITNIVSNKKYVGHSRNITKRWDTHKHNLRRNLSQHTHLQNAWNKYGEKMFLFSIIEEMPLGLSTQEYEKVETKWVLFFKTHQSKFGYNSVLPGSFLLKKKEENITIIKRSLVKYVCINCNTKEVFILEGSNNVTNLTTIKSSKIGELVSYWENKGTRKSIRGWIIVREKNYNPEFNYIDFKKVRKDANRVKKTWKDFYNKERYRKNPDQIMPYAERNLKRIPVIAVDIVTGIERMFPSVASCFPEFDKVKVRKCISHEFMKYKHRGHYFRKA